jgi:hypothetical protein
LSTRGGPEDNSDLLDDLVAPAQDALSTLLEVADDESANTLTDRRTEFRADDRSISCPADFGGVGRANGNARRGGSCGTGSGQTAVGRGSGMKLSDAEGNGDETAGL